MKRATILAIVSLIVAAAVWWHHDRVVSQSHRHATVRSDEPPQSENADTPDAKTLGPVRTRSAIRPETTRPTIDETVRLLRETVLPDFHTDEDITVTQCVEQLNQAIRAQGIPENLLRVTVNRTDLMDRFRIRAGLRLKNSSVAEILKYGCDCTMLRYRVVTGGRVEMWIAGSDPSFEMETPPEHLPSGDQEPISQDPNDPFGGTVPDQRDPFDPQ